MTFIKLRFASTTYCLNTLSHPHPSNEQTKRMTRIISRSSNHQRVILEWIQHHQQPVLSSAWSGRSSLDWLSRGSTVKGDDLSEQSRDREWQGERRRREEVVNGVQPNKPNKRAFPQSFASRGPVTIADPLSRCCSFTVSSSTSVFRPSSCGHRVYTPRMTLVPPRCALRS